MYRASDWTPEYLQLLVDQGAAPTGLQDAQAGRFGLGLTFNVQLKLVDRFVIEGAIIGILGRDTQCCIEEWVVRPGSGETYVRIGNARPEQLLAVAAALTNISPDPDIAAQRAAIELWNKRYVAEDLQQQWRSTAAEVLQTIDVKIEPVELETFRELDPAYAHMELFTHIGRGDTEAWSQLLAPVLLTLRAGALAVAGAGVPEAGFAAALLAWGDAARARLTDKNVAKG